MKILHTLSLIAGVVFLTSSAAAHPQNGTHIPLNIHEIMYSGAGSRIDPKDRHWIVVNESGSCVVYPASYDASTKVFTPRGDRVLLNGVNQIIPEEFNQRKKIRVTVISSLEVLEELEKSHVVGPIEWAHILRIDGCQFFWEEIKE